MKCAILNDYQNVALFMADWSPVLDRVEVVSFRRHLDEDEAAAALQDFDIIVLMRERLAFGRRLLERLPKLRLLVTTGENNPSIDIAAAAELGVTACGTGSLHHPTAELTWGLILGLLRHLPQEDCNLREGGPWQLTIGADLNGKILGILGLGILGTRIARVARAFDMTVIAWSHNLTAERCAAVGVEYATRRELLWRSDILTVHTNLSRRTIGLIGAAELAQMKPSAYLVNTSRGPIVDEAALIDALRRGVIAGAALDVFDTEPLPPDHPLRTLPNTLLTPHLGYVTEQNYRVFFGLAVQDIRAWLDGHPIRQLEIATQIDRSK